jgi:hypothetical protein
MSVLQPSALEFQVTDFNFQGSHRRGFIKDGLNKLIELIGSVELWRGKENSSGRMAQG